MDSLWFYTLFSIIFMKTQALFDCPRQVYESACSISGTVTFKSWNGNPSPACGATIPTSDLAAPPVIDWPGGPAGTYTILMLDVDYTYSLPGVYHLLWALANVPFQEGLKLSAGSTLAAYTAPDLSLNSGIHRIVVLIFKHNFPTQRISEPISEFRRTRFWLSSWVYSYRDILTCVPVAGYQVSVRL